MTIVEIEMRIKEIEQELATLKDDVGDATSYIVGIAERRENLERELKLLKEDLKQLKSQSSSGTSK